VRRSENAGVEQFQESYDMLGKSHLTGVLLVGAVMGFVGSPALADVCLTVDGVTQTLSSGTQGTDCTASGEQKIFLNKSTNTNSGSGQVGSQTGPLTVDFSSGTALDFANGFSTIKPHANGHDANYGDLTIEGPDGFTFTDLLWGLQMQNLTTTDLTVTAWDGSTEEGSWNLTGLSHDADQQYDLIASAGQAFTSVVLTAADTAGIKESKQFEISGLTVPEPSTWAMMIIGFVGLGYAGFRKAKSRVAVAA
jgi:hypothetical protein